MVITGRPPMYSEPADLLGKIVDYFENGVNHKEVVTKEGLVSVAVPTITGLVLHCGFCDRSSFYKYEEKPEFRHIIKNARTAIENHYEELMQAGGGAGAIFALKNFGWSDQPKEAQDNGIAAALEKIADKLPE